MKKIVLFLLILIVFFACESSKKEANANETISSVVKNNKPKKIIIPPFPKFSSVKEMLEDTNDYSEFKSTLQFYPKKNTLRVSSRFIETELKQIENIKKQVNHDIVYVAFQAFSQTDINEVTITSIPIVTKDFSDKVLEKNYSNNLKKTITINRLMATTILEKYLNTSSFNDLYVYPDTISGWTASDKFDLIKYKMANEVVYDLENMH